MSKISIGLVMGCFCLWTITGAAQQMNFPGDSYKINLINASFIPAEKTATDLRPPNLSTPIFQGKYFKLIQFYEIPNSTEQRIWSTLGLDFVDYLPKNTFYAVVDEGFDFQFIQDKIRAVLEVDERFKLEPEIYQSGIPYHAIDETGNYNLVVSYYDVINAEAILSALQNISKINAHRDYSRQIDLTIAPHLFEDLIKLPFVQFVGAILPPAESEVTYWRGSGRTNFISSGYNGLNFSGAGVTIAVGEGGYVGEDTPDFKGRLTETVSSSSSASGHKNGVIARAGGAGNLNPADRGVAWGSHVISTTGGTNYSGLYNSNNLRFTNHSFGYGVGGSYNSSARNHDLFVTNYPAGAVAYSCGNNGGSTGYSPYNGFSGWGNITGSPKHNKNNFACASTNAHDAPTGFSSSGPAYDGRVIPQLAIEGGGGTSHAAPKVVGNLGILSEVYSTYIGGEAPSSALKAVLMNTADDIGNEGIDFKTGYGRINMRRAHDVLSGGQLITDNVDQGSSKIHNVVVPANTHQLRVLVYWRDVAASTGVATALVNDLDLTVTDPASGTHLPWVLDHTPNIANLSALPTQMADHLNNVEQVTIDNPAAGTYMVNINGFSVPTGPQEYFVVYEFLEDELQLISPINNDRFVPGTDEVIYWDSYGSSTSSFSLQYQLNNGAWQTITTASASERSYTWTPPSVVGGVNSMKVRVSRDGLISESGTCSLGEKPSFLIVEWSCADAVKLNWGAVDGATDYQVYMLGTNFMEPVTSGITYNGASAIITGVTTTEDAYFAVAAISNGNEGRRTDAIVKPLGDINCENVFTFAPQSITKTGATLSGAINPHNASVSNVKFEYGPTTAYGSQTSTISVTASGHEEKKVTFPIAFGLVQGSQLHYRLIANIDGSLIQGEDVTLQLAPSGAVSGGGGNYVSVGKNTDLNFGSNQDFSVGLWVKTTATTNDATIISDKDWDSGGNAGWGIFFTGGTWKVNISDGNDREDINNIGTINDGDWHHLGVSFDRNGLMSVYQDGRFLQSTTISGITGNIDTNFPLNIFADGEVDYFFSGEIDEINIWNRVLTESEFQDQFHHPLAGNDLDLIAYWRFDEGGLGLEVVNNLTTTFNGSSVISSTAPIGIGGTDILNETTGVVTGTNANLEFNFLTHDFATIVSSKIELSPNGLTGLSGVSEPLDQQYWTIHRHGGNALEVAITFSLEDDLTASDEANPSQILLYYRAVGADTDWILETTADAVSAAIDEATFSGITTLNKQFLIVRDPSPVVSTSESTLNYNNMKFGCISAEQSYTLSGFNLTNDMQINAPTGVEISESSGGGFSSSLSFPPTSGSVVKTIYVRLNPNSTGVISGDIVNSSIGSGTRTVTIPAIEVVDVTDVAGLCLEFKENTDYLIIEDLNWAPNTFTIEWWLKPYAQNNWNQQIGNGWGGFLFHANSNGSVSVGTTNNSASRINSQTGLMTLNEWQHFAYSYDNGKAIFYRNGVELGASTNASGINWSTFRIGHTGSHSINGELDEFRMWSSARTAEEIRENMHLSQTGFEPNLKVYLQFQANDNNVVDLSQNCYTISVTGTPTRGASDVAVAGGVAVCKEVNAGGLVSFDDGVDTGIDIDFGTAPNGCVTVAHLMTEAPHGSTPSTSYTVQSDYWIIQNHGAVTTGLDADLTFNMGSGYVVNQTSTDYEMFKRSSASVSTWDTPINPTNMDMLNNQLTFNSIDGFSQFTVARNPNASVLPIELIDFSAQLIEYEVLLTWHTAMEINNQGFDIQRSTNNQNWDIIGWENGKGDTENGHAYQFIDRTVTVGNQY